MAKEKLFVKKIPFKTYVFGLAVLLLLSPCKVRNFIQAGLDLPQTEVSNKSQSTVSQAFCKILVVSDAVEATSKPIDQLFNDPHSQAEQSTLEVTSHKPCFSFYTSRNLSVSEVSLYILYQNLQIYS